jgi:hypothetical protein
VAFFFDGLKAACGAFSGSAAAPGWGAGKKRGFARSH